MSLAALMLAAIVVLRGFLRGKGIWLLVIGILAVPLVVLRAVRFVPQKPLTRIDVSFIGYRIPLTAIDPCSASADPMHAGGVWIGGGERDDGDPTPDVVTMPGFRPHLAQICTEGAAVRARRFVVRTIQPGLDLNGQLPADAQTQRIVLDGVGGASMAPRWGECVSSATASMKAEQVTEFVEQSWRAQDETVERKLRARLLASIRHIPHLGPPPGQDVYCVDINSGAPRPCDHDAKDYRSMLFLWRVPRWGSLAKWTALPPVGWTASDCRTKLNADDGAVVIEPPEATTALSKSAINSFPGVSVSMISRRMTGGVADVNLPRAFDKFSPAPFRIGKPRVIRFARN
ncbi:MAG TPA: hypothetical protein VHU41_17755, partial [Thermoanaerobaculia bacterium]|nr:hypothetical protein [Thermoanaerobaculia bacterium]